MSVNDSAVTFEVGGDDIVWTKSVVIRLIFTYKWNRIYTKRGGSNTVRTSFSIINF